MVITRKTITVIMVYISLNVSIFSNSLFYATGEFSYFSELVEQDKTDVCDESNLEFLTSVLVGLEYNGLFAETELNTYMVKADSYMFQPYTQEYLIRVGYSLYMFRIQYEHLCAHSIDNLGDNYGHNKFSIMFDTRGY